MTTEQIQCYLAAMGYYRLRYTQPPRKGTLAIDGIKGPSLTAAVKKFQQDRGLSADGIPGPDTQSEIRKAVGEGWEALAPVLPQNPKDIPGAVYDFLIDQGFSAAGACGIMGNIDAESAMDPMNLEDQYESSLKHSDESYTAAVDDGSYNNFTGDHAGYGLCQWTWWSRKTNLLFRANQAGKSIGDLTMQLDFLMHELNAQWPDTTKALKDPNISLREATRIFMQNYEDPNDQSDEAIDRRTSISQIYYDRYAKG